MISLLCKLLIKFHNEWSDDRFSYLKREQVVQQRLGVIWLSVYYFFQLFAYRILVEMDGVLDYKGTVIEGLHLKFDAKLWMLWSTLAGALVVAALLWLARVGFAHKDNRLTRWYQGKTIRYALTISSFIGVLGTAILLYYAWHPTISEWFFKIGKALFAFSWAPAVGLAVVWMCENLYLHLRLSSIFFMGIFGFSGACLASLLGNHAQYISDTSKPLYLLSAIGMSTMALMATFFMLLILLCRGKYLNDALLPNPQVSGERNPDKQGKNHLSAKFKVFWGNIVKERQKIVAACVLGLSVQFFTFFVGVYEKISRKDIVIQNDEIREMRDGIQETLYQYKGRNTASYDWLTRGFYNKGNNTGIIQKPRPSYMSALRYFGMVIGSFWVLKRWLSNKKNKKFYRTPKKAIGRLITIMSGAICIIFIVFSFGDKHIFYEWIFNHIVVMILGIAVGFGCVVWLIAITHVAENFNLEIRPWIVLLAPNIYRASELILQLRAETKFHISPEYSPDVSVAVLSWGCMFLFISYMGNLTLNNNFENDALYLPQDADIDSMELRRVIKKQKDDASSPETYYSAINQLLNERFVSIFKEHYYMSALYYGGTDRYKIADTGFAQNGAAYKIYFGSEKGSYVSAYDAHLKLLKDYTIQNRFASWSARILDNMEIKGGILWLSGEKGRELDHTFAPQDYEIINLSKIDVLDDGFRKQCHLNLSNGDEGQIIDLYKNRMGNETESPFDATPIFEDIKLSTPNVGDKERLGNTLAFFKLDAERYDPERYYLYVIKPFTSVPQLHLIINTVVPFSQKHLQQLRTLVGFAESEWDKKVLADSKHNAAYKEIMQHQSHTSLHTYGAANRSAERVTQWMDNNEAPEQIKEDALQIQSTIGYLSKITKFNLAMIRARKDDSEYYLWNELSPLVQTNFRKSPTDLKNLVQEIYAELLYSSDIFKTSIDGHRDNIKTMLRDKITNPKPLGVTIDCIEAGIRIVLTDLIKNAIERTQPQNPEIEIFAEWDVLYEGAMACKLTFKNNRRLHPVDYEEVMKPMNKSKLGIRTIKEIINLPFLVGHSENDPKIVLGIDPPEIHQHNTFVYLYIPIKYVTN